MSETRKAPLVMKLNSEQSLLHLCDDQRKLLKKVTARFSLELALHNFFNSVTVLWQEFRDEKFNAPA